MLPAVNHEHNYANDRKKIINKRYTCLPASYIAVCGRRDPNLDKCIENSVATIVDKLRTGIPEMDIPSVDPLSIGTAVLTDLPNFKAVGSDMKLGGLSYYRVNSLHLDIEKRRVDINITSPTLLAEGIFTISARILFPIEEKGNLIVNASKLN